MKRVRGRTRRVPGTMNKTEQRYADELKAKLSAGEIEWYEFEGVKLRLAKNTTYTPDFAVMHNDGIIELVEIKGHWESSARVKIKVAADKYWMFTFTALKPATKKQGGGWIREEFNL